MKSLGCVGSLLLPPEASFFLLTGRGERRLRGGEDDVILAALQGDLGRLKGVTPLMTAAQSGDVSTVRYLVERGGDLMKPDEKGRTVLHHAACTGSTKVTEFLLSKGIPVDIDYGHGTALHQTVINEQDKTVKILLDHHANLGRLPVELAALNDCMEEVEMLFPLTSPIPGVPNWSVDGVISHAKLKNTKPLAIDHAPDATLYSNRSLCRLHMGDGEGALSDAYKCRMMRPDWAKGCYRQAAAYMLLGENKQAHDALLDAQKLDPGNEEIDRELRKAMELMKVSPDEDQQ
ncbi:hypothetical protein BAE44_0015693 [Dichanthelium oligosanthes]|uniref:Uncharacterized protein n=1 Tax=Dichanthelium oligosanthes TaxID=888268 RepID=A0A1E5VDR4_9POAL|nr:hypothetical protein BAE44_0015693 [Dichanthelium oligosanthes]